MLTVKKNGQKAWVTFTFTPKEEVFEVCVCGEWNDWTQEPMKRKKSGDFYIIKILQANNSFEFGYKIDGEHWSTESECPKVLSPYLSENSLLKL